MREKDLEKMRELASASEYATEIYIRVGKDDDPVTEFRVNYVAGAFKVWTIDHCPIFSKKVTSRNFESAEEAITFATEVATRINDNEHKTCKEINDFISEFEQK